LPLRLSFFGLTNEYMKSVYDQLLYMSAGIAMTFKTNSSISISFYKPFSSYSEVYRLPIGLRKYYYNKMLEEAKKLTTTENK